MKYISHIPGRTNEGGGRVSGTSDWWVPSRQHGNNEPAMNGYRRLPEAKSWSVGSRCHAQLFVHGIVGPLGCFSHF